MYAAHQNHVSQILIVGVSKCKISRMENNGGVMTYEFHTLFPQIIEINFFHGKFTIEMAFPSYFPQQKVKFSFN
jgi:hypothetical protein